MEKESNKDILKNKNIDTSFSKKELSDELNDNSYVKDIEESEIKRNYIILKRKYNDLIDVHNDNNKIEEVRQKTQRH
jgi:hypothetical protein